ncbi:MAG: MOSC domain-containing protein [Alphaproteobacteria bacterium]
MTATLARIYRYPVKGLTAEPLARVRLEPGKRLPGDRRYAIEHGGGTNHEAREEWQPKAGFLNLMRDERLALLEARFEEASGVLVLYRGGKRVARGDLSTSLGRTLIEQFLAAFMKEELRGAAKLVEAREGGFTDAPEPWLSLVNLASVRDLGERIVGGEIDPLRFRANLYLEGLAPWRELDLVGREIGIGPVRLKVERAITRCAAVNVNPATGARDLNLPRALEGGIGHANMGVYAEVLSAGEIECGASCAVAAA